MGGKCRCHGCGKFFYDYEIMDDCDNNCEKCSDLHFCPDCHEHPNNPYNDKNMEERDKRIDIANAECAKNPRITNRQYEDFVEDNIPFPKKIEKIISTETPCCTAYCYSYKEDIKKGSKRPYYSPILRGERKVLTCCEKMFIASKSSQIDFNYDVKKFGIYDESGGYYDPIDYCPFCGKKIND